MKTRADLKPGDPVLVRHNGMRRKAAVARVTKTQLTLDDGSRWIIRTGRRVNAPKWDLSQVEAFNPVEWAEYLASTEATVTRNKLVQRFAAVCARLSPEQIARISAVLDEVGK